MHLISSYGRSRISDMAEQTVSRVLVIRFNLKGFQELADIADDRVCCLIFSRRSSTFTTLCVPSS